MPRIRLPHLESSELTMRLYWVSMIAVLGMVIGFNQTSWAEATDEPAVSAAEVIDASKAIVSAFGADDPETYFEFFDPEATFIFYGTPQRLESRAAYQQEWASWRQDLGFRVRSCTSSEQRVQLLGDVAILTHLVRTEITTTQGQETLQERETIVFHHRGNRWVAVHEHLSPRPLSSESE